MHPAASVIIFTVSSGMGYGLLIWLVLLACGGALPADRALGAAGLGIALVLITGGLLASTFHLGHPERAWRALSQWRTSWLSREGVFSLATYPFALLFAAGWVLQGSVSGIWAVAGLGAALLALVTLGCTGMIYASLRPIPEWHNRWVVPVYISLGLAGGALWLALLAAVFGVGGGWPYVLAVLALVVAGLVKGLYWGAIDAPMPSRPQLADAIGVRDLGAVRPLDPPHTSPNYLQREMGFEIARRHAARLRQLVWASLLAVPLVLVLMMLVLPQPLAIAAGLLVVVSGGLGLLVERWLFFAQARHLVNLYYGGV